ncbi:MAG: hypothetical protein Q8Q31_00675 [Nanoarchaeota archaeon]|nr:hypothetical protein [Nanoarchaeota archaeon]
MKFGKIAALGGLAAILSGCMTTQNHDLKDISRVNRSSARVLTEGINAVKATNEVIRASGMTNNYNITYPTGTQNPLSYSESKRLSETYSGILPKLNANFYFPTNDTVITENSTNRVYGFDMQEVNTTGPLNSYLDEIKRVEDKVRQDRPGYVFLDVGNADRNFASDRSADNQFSRQKGILGVEFHSQDLTNKFASYVAHESANGDLSITLDFASPEFNGKFRRNVVPAIGVMAGQAGTAYVILRETINSNAGLAGAAGVGAAELLDFTVGYFEGRKAPGETMMVQSRNAINIGLEDSVARNLAIFERAKHLGAKDVALFEDKEGGLGIVYGNNFKSVNSDGNTLTVVVDGEAGVNWKAFALGLAKGAAAAGAAHGVYDWKFDSGNGGRSPPPSNVGSGGRIDEGPSVTNPGQGNVGTGGRVREGISVRGN